jgi:riboflavin kinase/FMN adenylyltransferase
MLRLNNFSTQSWEQCVEFGIIDFPGTKIAGSAVTVGVFDGVHLGHRALIEKIVEKKREREHLVPVVVTFTEHPRGILNPTKKWLTLTDTKKKLDLLENLGVERVILIDFCEKIRKIDGGDFLCELKNKAKMKYMCIGYDFRMGYENAFDAQKIIAFNKSLGVETEIAGPVMDTGRPVSSSRIRDAIRGNDIPLAERLLGYSGLTAKILGE